ncbi:lysophosphatidylcholine acyltransferase [Ascoidea rubescens DSM 1968]|uniref:Tafazzin family protein n=1 Tax=Ascoidea rubescens DSM 1968 TaxID=1344418 RepID=A0A1D2VME4_9ASCO|nr:monolysocardiolipin acyltransferase [Ascoidea rubescens DSM 1968]ODV62783.1 monolysocardiolipin acyltransferase [Ascoidea rubescens DSM 1968]
MTFPSVLQRGDDFLKQYPRRNRWWNYLSQFTCFTIISASKLFVYTVYKPQIQGLNNLTDALNKARRENRALLTVMNHMSVVDDPLLWGVLPMKFYFDIDNIRWGLGASNVCFKNPTLNYFFSFGKILSTERFGVGPFQGSVDAAIRILSPDDSVPEPFNKQENLPINRKKTSWLHIFPEGFVLQLEPPHHNSMRYFRWGISRLVLESVKPPVILPIFSTGFEKIAPEDAAESAIKRYLPRNFRNEINIVIGKPIDDSTILKYREKWENLVESEEKKLNAKLTDFTENLKNGSEAKDLRSDLAAYVRSSVLNIRDTFYSHLPQEDQRMKDPGFWKRFTLSEGKSDPDIIFIGKNWAIKRFQKFLHDDFDKQVKEKELQLTKIDLEKAKFELEKAKIELENQGRQKIEELKENFNETTKNHTNSNH